MKCLLWSTWGWLRIDWLLMVKVHLKTINNVLKRLCFMWHQRERFWKYQHSIPLTNVVMSVQSAWVIVFSPSIPPCCGYVCTSPPHAALILTQILVSPSTLPQACNWYLGKGKTGWKQSWCWDFVVSGEVYELLLTGVWPQQITCCKAGRERKEVLPFSGSSMGGSGQ